MKLTLLGTGTSTGVPEIACRCAVCTSTDPHEKRLRTSAVVEYNGKNILIDCGPDFRAQMLAWGGTHLEAVLLTHEHYDHVGGLDDLRPFAAKGTLPIYAEKKVVEALKTRMPYCFVQRNYPGVPDLALREITTAPFSIGEIPILPIRVYHYRLPILGYRIGNLAYITDMLTLPETEYDKLKGVEVLVVNALRREKHLSHQNLDEALAFINRVQPCHAYLTHLSHHMGLMSDVAPLLSDNVSIAYDGLQITTNRDEEKEIKEGFYANTF